MDKHYDVAWLTDRTDSGTVFKFLLFWGHTGKVDNEVDKTCFSQWYPAPFSVEGITYKTAEHWMMAQKALLFDDSRIFDRVIECAHAAEAKELGRNIIGYNDEEWNRRKFAIVKQGNIYKFNQDPKLAAYLLSTGDRVLVEASPVDNIWGIGLAQNNKDAENVHEWRGENLLGFALMEVRDFLGDFGLFEPLQAELPPPWIKYPGIHPFDMFWRMGKGEDYIGEFARYFDELSDRDRKIYMLCHPQPFEWLRFYED